jgi:DNA adenine methylase
MSEAKITAIAPWLGSKRNLAPEIVRELGPHRVYWEPTCGSMAVLLSKPPCTMETVNDLHGDLTNLARVIKHPVEGPRLYRRLRRTLVSEGLYLDSSSAIPAPYDSDDLDGERAYHYFLASWLGRNGNSGTMIGGSRGTGRSFCVRYTHSGGATGKRFGGVVSSIPSWRRRLAQVTILRRDAFEVIGKVEDAVGVAVYVDPPYLRETRTSFDRAKGCGGTSRYLHEFSEADHGRLSEALGRFRRTRVVVSYYDHPRLPELYPGWRLRRIEVSKALSNQGRRDQAGATKATEVLLVNDGKMF